LFKISNTSLITSLIICIGGTFSGISQADKTTFREMEV